MSKQYQGLRKRLLAVAVAGAIGCAGVATAAVPVGTQFVNLTQATQLGRGDVVQSATPISRPVRVTMALKLRNPAQLQAYIAARHAPLTHAQLASKYLPTTSQAQAVANYMRHEGFTNVKISSNRMLVSGNSSVGTAQAAFKTTLVNVRSHDGRDAFANSSPIKIPASLRGTVQAVLGLQTLHRAHIMARPMQAPAGAGVFGHSPLDFPNIYDASGLPAATSINVGIIGWGSMSQTVADLSQFTSSNGLPAVNTEVVCIDYGGYNSGVINTTDPSCALFDEGATEWDLDSQDIVAMTGGVNSLTFYAAYGGYNASITNAINEVVTPSAGEPLAQVVNQSFGECERNEDSGQGGDGSAQIDDQLYMLGAAQGQTFSASTGDSGSDECGDGQLDSASYPASSPWNVAVSGTTLRASTTTWARENVWLDAGGSPSSFEVAQPWQTGLTYGPFAGMRGPDVAFDASPASGAIIVVFGSLEQVGGTSLASPLFVGSWARILQSLPDEGFAAPQIYTLPASVLHDIRAGNNGQYIAKPGWDWATGLGSFDVGAAEAALSGGE